MILIPTLIPTSQPSQPLLIKFKIQPLNFINIKNQVGIVGKVGINRGEKQK